MENIEMHDSTIYRLRPIESLAINLRTSAAILYITTAVGAASNRAINLNASNCIDNSFNALNCMAFV